MPSGLLAFILMMVIFSAMLFVAAKIARRPVEVDPNAPPPLIWRFFSSLPMKLMMLVVVPGALTLFFALNRQFTIMSSDSWGETDGFIYGISMEEIPGSLMTTYTAHVDYRYEVDGESYNGFQITFGDARTPDKAYIEGLLTKYPSKSDVTVYYDPDFPYNSVLERTAGVTTGRLWAVAIVALALGWVFTLGVGRSMWYMRHYYAALPPDAERLMAKFY